MHTRSLLRDTGFGGASKVMSGRRGAQLRMLPSVGWAGLLGEASARGRVFQGEGPLGEGLLALRGSPRARVPQMRVL